MTLKDLLLQWANVEPQRVRVHATGIVTIRGPENWTWDVPGVAFGGAMDEGLVLVALMDALCARKWEWDARRICMDGWPEYSASVYGTRHGVRRVGDSLASALLKAYVVTLQSAEPRS